MSRYVIVSDLHLGQTGLDKLGQYSILSSTVQAEKKADDFIVAANSYLKPTKSGCLIAVGDLLDLSLSYIQTAFSELQLFLDRLEYVDRLIWVVGNHDHHVWMQHSEVKLFWNAAKTGVMNTGQCVYQDTLIGGEGLSMIGSLPLPSGRMVQLQIAYPVLKLTGNGRDYYFTHGHLFGGPPYTTLSEIVAGAVPPNCSASSINFPIIELFYWLLGEMGGGMGADGLIETLIIDLQKGHDSKLQPLLRQMVNQIIPEGIVPGLPDNLERELLASLIRKGIKRFMEKQDNFSTSSQRHKSIDETRSSLAGWISKNGIQGSYCLFHGHTHVADEWPIGPKQRAFNMGSWLREPQRLGGPEPTFATLDLNSGIVQYVRL